MQEERLLGSRCGFPGDSAKALGSLRVPPRPEPETSRFRSACTLPNLTLQLVGKLNGDKRAEHFSILLLFVRGGKVG